MIAVFIAMQEEIKYLEEKIEKICEKEIYRLRIIEGKIKDKNVILVNYGIGKVNAAFAASYILTNYRVSKIMTSGISGGKSPLKIKDVVLPKKYIYLDIDIEQFGNKKGQVPGEKEYFLPDQKTLELIENCLVKENINYYNTTFYTSDTFVRELKDDLDEYSSFDMETCAIAQVADKFNLRISSVRFISDVIDSKDHLTDYAKFEKESSHLSSLITLKVIEEL